MEGEGGGQNGVDPSDPSLLGDLVGSSIGDTDATSGHVDSAAANGANISHDMDLQSVELGQPNQVAKTEWQPLEDPLSFIMRVIDTARENRDTLQAALPGYRERIVKVRLSSAEGGMNLITSQENIDNMKDKGVAAGNLLACNFNFKHHQWTRFLALMSELETELQKFGGALVKGKYKELLLDDVGSRTKDISDDYPYLPGHGPEWRKEAYECVEALNAVLSRWGQVAASNTGAMNMDAKLSAAPDTAPDTAPEAAPDTNASPVTINRSVAQKNCDCSAIEFKPLVFNCKPPQHHNHKQPKDYNPQPKSVLRMNPEI